MSFDNINDPEGVKALLDTLRSSQAWAKAVESSEVAHPSTLPPQGVQPFDSLRVSAPGPEDAGAPSIKPSPPNLSHGTPSVADLLSQLQATQIPTSGSNTAQCSRTLDPPAAPRDHSNTPSTSNTSSDHTPPPQLDVRTLSFQQSLAHISRLGEDPNVVADLVKMKQEQDKLEKQLWDERVGIQKRHEKKVQVETTKAKLIGVDLSERERKLMSDAFQKELRKFDAERVLPAWDGLVRGQQARLEALKVPTMFVTNDPSDMEKQRLVVNVLEGILP
ncbi:hypothetical protein EDB85DRAFT_2150393 [Lactarius pseudohatsudake]|nr:hypothetical protein EDB85DRAFT_2150393 [Lactarius pseudohatsudake]